jgi:hypothetical protein
VEALLTVGENREAELDIQATQRDAMHNHRRWLTVTVYLISVILAGVAGLRAELPKAPKRLTAIEVITAWRPYINDPKDFQQSWASPERSPDVAACSFRVEGPSIEELWNHYADLCGIGDRYRAKTFLTTGNVGAKGSYVVTERTSSDAKAERGLSVFLLKNDRYVVTVTIQPDLDGKALCGSIAAVIP